MIVFSEKSCYIQIKGSENNIDKPDKPSKKVSQLKVDEDINFKIVIFIKFQML